jgi:BirA family biotin operon repressor/biotin-[acetyl-CoA-carboxylase] ligase
MASAIAAAEAIGECGSNYPTIKWSNDIFINHQKIAGILIEAKGSDFVIGIGINCHQRLQDFPEELRQQATSIDIQNGSYCDRNFIAKRLLISLDDWIYSAQTDISKVKDRWKQLCPFIGSRLSIVHNNNVYTGYCRDIDPEYGLVLVLENGAVRMFDAAQSSIFKGSL